VKKRDSEHLQEPNRGQDSSIADLDDPFSEPVLLPLGDSIDLHTFLPKEVKSVVEEYIYQCYEAGLHEVRIVHGKGIGVQREMVRTLLAKIPCVLSFQDAPPEAGGWGATTVTLREKNKTC
jgi:DNA-nicking Smr family endonuclease